MRILRSLYLAFVLEALISGFYVVITRSLAPIYLAMYGMDMKSIVLAMLYANIVALGLALLVYERRKLFLFGNIKRKLVLYHGLERVLWGSIPFAAALGRTVLMQVIAGAVAITILTSSAMNVAMIKSFDSEKLKKLFAHRSALGALSSVVGQIFALMVLWAIPGIEKYNMLFLLAMSVGLIATIIIALPPMPTLSFEKPREEVEELARATTAFIFLTTMLISIAILSVVWGPHIVKDLNGAEWIAVALGLVQTVVNIGASLFWQRRRYVEYRYALALAAPIPLLIAWINEPLLHLAIAALLSFATTGANFLASFVFADLTRRIDVSRASILLSTSWILAQVLGLGVSYVLLEIGVGFEGVAVTCMVFSTVSVIIAFTMLPEVAVVPPHHAMIYARHLYAVSTASYNFVLFTVRSYVILALRLLAIGLTFMVLYVIYRVLLYLASVP